MAQVKHYAVYNQETYRNTAQDNAVVADRTEREIYLPAFEAAIKQGKADSAMCSYASVNGTFACENGLLQNTILKQQWGFSGFVTSDWGGTHSTVASANNGLDQEMTGSTYFGDALTAAVNNGQVSQATIDDHVRRILTSMFARGLFDAPPTGTMGATVTSAAHVSAATKVAEEGSVLLKNAGTLPLGSSASSIAVIGDDAGANAMTAGGGSAHVNPSPASVARRTRASRHGRRGSRHVRPGRGLAERPGRRLLLPDPSAGLTGQYYDNTGLSGTPVLTRNDPNVNFLWGGQPRRPACRATAGRRSGPARSSRRPPARTSSPSPATTAAGCSSTASR